MLKFPRREERKKGKWKKKRKEGDRRLRKGQRKERKGEEKGEKGKGIEWGGVLGEKKETMK